MNREIKFRGKTIKNDEWIYGDLKHNETYSICYDKNDVYFEVDDKTVGQFTGLLDINCKEIYEGDIVSCVFFHYYTGSEVEEQLKGVIEWFQGGFIIKVIENDFENAGQYSISDLYIDTTMQVEVLGNVFDNPEQIIFDDENEENAN